MRKLFLVLMIALLASSAALAETKQLDPEINHDNCYMADNATTSVVVITEDFEDGIPDSWTVTEDDGSGLAWSNLTGPGCGECNYVNTSADVACVSSDEWGGASYDTSLITPAYDFSASVNSGMEIDAIYNKLSADEVFYIDCSTDSGGTWTNFVTWNTDHPSSFFCGGPGEDVSIDLSAYDGEANVICRFRYFDATSGWNWYVQVDNFELLSDGVIVEIGGGDGGGVPATTGIGLALLVLALGGGSAYFLRRK